MPGGADLEGDQVIKLVTPVGGGGQAQPAPCRDLLDGVLERGRWYVVAFVGDHQPVPTYEGRDVGAAGQGLQGDDVDGAFDFRPAAADLDRMAELVETYADFPLGLVDASVIAVAERLNADAVATLDHRHFSVVRPRHLPAFKLLPEASG